MKMISEKGVITLRPKRDLRMAVAAGPQHAAVGIYGTPDALRNLASLLLALAELRQDKLPPQSCPPSEGFHVDVMPQVYPSSEGNVRLIVGRLDCRADGSTDWIAAEVSYHPEA